MEEIERALVETREQRAALQRELDERRARAASLSATVAQLTTTLEALDKEEDELRAQAAEMEASQDYVFSVASLRQRVRRRVQRALLVLFNAATFVIGCALLSRNLLGEPTFFLLCGAPFVWVSSVIADAMERRHD